jgi:hypothetical protein
MSVVFLKCPEVVELVTEARDDELGSWMRLRYKAHLIHCRSCRRYVAQIDDVIAGAAELAIEPPASSDDCDAILAAVRRSRSVTPG